MKVQLIDVGRDKINKVVEVSSFKQLYKEVKKHLLSENVDLLNTSDPNTLAVIVGGFRPVGCVKILA